MTIPPEKKSEQSTQDPQNAADILRHAHKYQRTVNPVFPLPPDSKPEVLDGQVRDAEEPGPAPQTNGEQPTTPSEMVPAEPTIIHIPDKTSPPKHMINKKGRHRLDKTPDILTNAIIEVGIAMGLAKNGWEDLKGVGVEWAELAKRRIQMVNDRETFEHLQQQWADTVLFFDTKLGIKPAKLLAIFNDALLAKRKEDPTNYGLLPERNPMQSLLGMKVAMLEIIPQTISAIMALPSLASGETNTIVASAMARWRHQIEMQAIQLRADRVGKEEAVRERIETARLGAEAAIATELSMKGEIIKKGTDIKLDISQKKAGKFARWLIGATAPFAQTPIEFIEQTGGAIAKFAEENPIVAGGATITIGALVYGLAEGFSPATVIISVAGISLGALGQGLWNKYGGKKPSGTPE